MDGLFIERPHKIAIFMTAKGYGTGTPYDMCIAYFSQSNVNGKLYDMVKGALANLGYSGNVHDSLRKFFIDTTGISDPKTAERVFWANTSNDFFGGSGNAFQDTSGNTFTDTDGNIIRDTQ